MFCPRSLGTGFSALMITPRVVGAGGGLDKTSKCGERERESCRPSCTVPTLPLWCTLRHKLAVEQVQWQALARSGWHRLAKQIIPHIRTHRHPTGPNPITAPVLRHIGITTDVRKGRLDGLFVVFPLLVIRKSLRIKSCGETCWLGRKDPPRKN